jgi:hypothetical protein
VWGRAVVWGKGASGKTVGFLKVEKESEKLKLEKPCLLKKMEEFCKGKNQGKAVQILVIHISD